MGLLQKQIYFIMLGIAFLSLPIGLTSPYATAQSQTILAEGTFQPGDKVSVSIHNVDTLSGEYEVDANGLADFLYLGKIKVQDLSPDQVAAQLTSLYERDYLNNPQITAFIIRTTGTSTASQIGDSTAPKSQTSQNSTSGTTNSMDGFIPLSEFDFISTGTNSETETASQSQNQTNPFTSTSSQYVSPPSDSKGRVLISGEIGRPGIYVINTNQPISSLLRNAGNTNDTADLDEIIVFRREKGGLRNAYFVKFSSVLSGEITDPIIIPGDFIFIKSRNDEFEWTSLNQFLNLLELPLDIALQTQN